MQGTAHPSLGTDSCGSSGNASVGAESGVRFPAMTSSEFLELVRKVTSTGWVKDEDVVTRLRKLMGMLVEAGVAGAGQHAAIGREKDTWAHVLPLVQEELAGEVRGLGRGEVCPRDRRMAVPLKKSFVVIPIDACTWSSFHWHVWTLPSDFGYPTGLLEFLIPVDGPFRCTELELSASLNGDVYCGWGFLFHVEGRGLPHVALAQA